MICPICKSEMEAQRFMVQVRDGNTVWQCPTDKEHRFFKNMRERDVIHQDPYANNMNGKPIRTWNYSIEKIIHFEEAADDR